MAMSDIFAGLVKLPPMIETHHSVCFNVSSVHPLSEEQVSLFFIDRQVEKPVENKTANLLGLCEELIKQVKEKTAQLERMNQKCRELAYKVERLEEKVHYSTKRHSFLEQDQLTRDEICNKFEVPRTSTGAAYPNTLLGFPVTITAETPPMEVTRETITEVMREMDARLNVRLEREQQERIRALRRDLVSSDDHTARLAVLSAAERTALLQELDAVRNAGAQGNPTPRPPLGPIRYMTYPNPSITGTFTIDRDTRQITREED